MLCQCIQRRRRSNPNATAALCIQLLCGDRNSKAASTAGGLHEWNPLLFLALAVGVDIDMGIWYVAFDSQSCCHPMGPKIFRIV